MINNLFNEKEMYSLSHNRMGRSYAIVGLPARLRRQAIYHNMHLMEGMRFTRNNAFPILDPFTGSGDFDFVSYKDRNKHSGKNEACHFFLFDSEFRNAVWERLEAVTYSLQKFDCLLTPDFSLWTNLPTSFYNKESIFHTRFVGAYWQQCGFNVIPTASWGDLESFHFCFEGLPEHSVIAVSGMGNQRSSAAYTRWLYGLKRLEEEKSPILILIYGETVEIPGIHTPVKFIPGYIQKHFRNGKNNKE